MQISAEDSKLHLKFVEVNLIFGRGRKFALMKIHTGRRSGRFQFFPPSPLPPSFSVRSLPCRAARVLAFTAAHHFYEYLTRRLFDLSHSGRPVFRFGSVMEKRRQQDTLTRRRARLLIENPCHKGLQ